MLNERQFGGVARSLRRSGGFSINVQTGERPRSGWMVSAPGDEHRMPQAGKKEIGAYYDEHRPGLERAGHMGGWHNDEATPPEDVLDASRRYPRTKLGTAQAYTSMVANRQESSYNLGTKEMMENPAYRTSDSERHDVMSGKNVTTLPKVLGEEGRKSTTESLRRKRPSS